MHVVTIKTFVYNNYVLFMFAFLSNCIIPPVKWLTVSSYTTIVAYWFALWISGRCIDSKIGQNARQEVIENGMRFV